MGDDQEKWIRDGGTRDKRKHMIVTVRSTDRNLYCTGRSRHSTGKIPVHKTREERERHQVTSSPELRRSSRKHSLPGNNPLTSCNSMAMSGSSRYPMNTSLELRKLCNSSVTELYSKNGGLQHIDVFVHIYVARLLLLINDTRKQHNTRPP